MNEPFGLSSMTLQHINHAFQQNTLPQQSVRVFIFGSRARGTFKKYSDIDLLIEAVPPWTFKQKNQLKEGFDESSLPYFFDLVMADELDPAFEEQVQREKILLFEILSDRPAPGTSVPG